MTDPAKTPEEPKSPRLYRVEVTHDVLVVAMSRQEAEEAAEGHDVDLSDNPCSVSARKIKRNELEEDDGESLPYLSKWAKKFRPDLAESTVNTWLDFIEEDEARLKAEMEANAKQMKLPGVP
jgi:hypothetical protein